MAGKNRRGVVLVGHGAIPKDYPRDLLTKQKSLESQRRASGTPPTPEESALDGRIRHWPRSPQADPYQAGEIVASGGCARPGRSLQVSAASPMPGAGFPATSAS